MKREARCRQHRKALLCNERVNRLMQGREEEEDEGKNQREGRKQMKRGRQNEGKKVVGVERGGQEWEG